MNKRHFLHTALLAAAAPALPSARAAALPVDGPALLTVSGALTRPNRGALDRALDQLMGKHGLAFDQARSFTFTDLAALPAIEIRPTLEYDARVHALRGPLLATVLEHAGAALGETTMLVLRAFDGYTVELGAADLRRLSPIVATHLDGAPLPLGGLGPLWAVHDADRIPALAARPLAERFAQCPWGLYSVHVGAAGGR